jgi:hypothetical protein
MKIWPVAFSVGLLMLGGVRNASAATTTAANCSHSAVAAAIGAAVNGDTVVIPAGTCEWNRNLTIDKAITLQGQGIGKTVILDGVPIGSDPMEMITWRLFPGRTSRLTAIEFRPGSRTATSTTAGLINIEGSNVDGRRMRIDHCQFTELRGRAFLFFTALGVLDHNIFLIRSGQQGGVGVVKHSNWDRQNFGDGAWATGTLFGTDQFLFFEDNTITYMGTDRHVTVLDAQAGGRYVFRYNTITRGSIEGHGTESGNRERSTRAVEVYNNAFFGVNRGQIVSYFRGGVGLIHHNTITNYQQSSTALVLLSNRNTDSFAVWGGADGLNRFDKNASTTFASGRVATVGAVSMTASGVSWTANQWKGYVLRRTTNVGGVTGNTFSEITGNTNDTISYWRSLYGDTTQLKFTPGDSWEIRRVEHTMDQPGRSGGSLVSGNPPVLASAWNNQVTEPWYEWNNTRDGGIDVGLTAVHGTIRINEHYFNDRQPAGYEPYTYPHPITQGIYPDSSSDAGPGPSAPTNVRLAP